MAEATVLRNAYVAITTSTGSSTYLEIPGVKSFSGPWSRAELANSVMGDVAETMEQGLFSIPISITTRQDFTTTVAATSGADKLFYNLIVNGTKFRMKVRPVDSAVSGTNPSYIYNPIKIYSFTPIEGSHGQLLEQKAEFRLASNAGTPFSRSTST